MAMDETASLADHIKLDAATHQGVALHTFSIPSAALGSDGPWAALFGQNLDVVIGTGPGAAYLAVGRDAMTKLTAAIDASGDAPTLAATGGRSGATTFGILAAVGIGALAIVLVLLGFALRRGARRRQTM